MNDRLSFQGASQIFNFKFRLDYLHGVYHARFLVSAHVHLQRQKNSRAVVEKYIFVGVGCGPINRVITFAKVPLLMNFEIE